MLNSHLDSAADSTSCDHPVKEKTKTYDLCNASYEAAIAPKGVRAQCCAVRSPGLLGSHPRVQGLLLGAQVGELPPGWPGATGATSSGRVTNYDFLSSSPTCLNTCQAFQIQSDDS